MSIHPLSDVQTEAVGEGTRIWQYVVVLPGAKIGAGCNICSHVFIENDVVIGDGVTIKNGVLIYDGVQIEDGVFVGPGAVFTNDLYPRSRRNGEPCVPARTAVRKGASLGANCTVRPGVTIGAYALIGAGAVVTKDVPDHALVTGNPGRVAGRVDDKGRVVERF